MSCECQIFVLMGFAESWTFSTRALSLVLSPRPGNPTCTVAGMGKNESLTGFCIRRELMMTPILFDFLFFFAGRRSLRSGRRWCLIETRREKKRHGWMLRCVAFERLLGDVRSPLPCFFCRAVLRYVTLRHLLEVETSGSHSRLDARADSIS